MFEAKRIVRISPGTLYREVQGEAVLLQLDNGEYFGLDEVATRIWQLIVQHGDLDAVRKALLEEYDVTEAELESDVARVVDELAAKRLVEVDIVRS